ncbi:hypothetical protein CFC21_016351 [Triticum aestivum]|uniref:TIR domain-containing protein n=3 Tax=Triticum TaxID=4564 RepID=A0A9R1NPU3_TRITD|nr:TIR-only protein-like [Triticum dicoccoides]KAF7000440.1 hypothetical protein CFC21_016351 [Triticum aestivum]VAH28858.1 unnamed protein product [Triticum turgidum subsp. durum]
MASTGVSRRSSIMASRLSASAEAMRASEGGKQRHAVVGRRVEYDEESLAGEPQYDVFINHRGVDTKRTVARLLYDRLAQSGIRGFLDNMSMRPGDRLRETISAGISECSVAVAIFSPSYFDSEYCLWELATLVESRKTIIPIFYNIKPSDLVLPEALAASDDYLPQDVERYKYALREAKNTVGLTYDSATGDIAELVSAAADAVLYHMEKMERVQRRETIVSRL